MSRSRRDSNGSLLHFLLVYDRAKGSLVGSPEEFGDSEEAVEAYAAKERAFENQPGMEVVLIGSDSLDTVKITHANYFGGTVPGSGSKYLIAI